METKQEFKTVKALVTNLLATEERCRNDDKWLTYQVMRKFTNIYIPFNDFKKLPAFETIKRCRATLQNKENLYLPTDPKVIERRQKREKEIKEIVR